MFTFGWSEIFLIGIIVVVVIGPKDLPKFIKQVGSFTKYIKKMSSEFKSSINEIAEEEEIKELANSLISSSSAISFIDDLNSEDIFLIYLVKDPTCLMNFGRSFGPITTTTIIPIKKISLQPKVNIIFTFLRRFYSLNFYLLFFLRQTFLS